MQIKANTFSISIKLYEDLPMSGSWAKVLHKSGDFFVSRSLDWWDRSEWEQLQEIFDPNQTPVTLFCGTEAKEILCAIESIRIVGDEVELKVSNLDACNDQQFIGAGAARTKRAQRQLFEQRSSLIRGSRYYRDEDDTFSWTCHTIAGAFRSIEDKSGDITISDIPGDSTAISSRFGTDFWAVIQSERDHATK